MDGSATRAIAASKIFDGSRLHDDCAVVFQGARIIGIAPQAAVPGSTVVRRLPYGAWLAPGFIDTQVNGGGDVLFNDEPSPEGIAAIVKAHRRFGTTALLPTFLSDTRENMRRAWSAVKAVLGAEPGVLGIHFEGPFLSPERAGVHDPRLFRSPEPADLELLRPLPGAVTLVTLAPEQVAPRFIRQLATAGTRVSLGHSMATYAETKAAIFEGLTGFTHLFNAMRPLASREPGPIAAALEDPEVWYGMIVDGHHVAPAMLQLALRGGGRPMLVSDAMSPVGGSRTAFSLYGSDIIARGPCCYTRDGTLAGTALDMASAVRNCVRLLGLPLTEALRLAGFAPAAFLGLDDRLGRIASGYRADMVAIDPEVVEVLTTWVAGEEMPVPGAVNAIR